MAWETLINTGPPLTQSNIDEFEKAAGVRIPNSLARFWHTWGNGGRLQNLKQITVRIEDRVETPSLHGFYGIKHQKKTYDLESMLGDIRITEFFPFAFDELNGHFFIATDEAREGEVFYGEWDDIVEGNSSRFVRIAANLSQFLDELDPYVQ